jgi:hypothetical protein
MYTYQQHSHAIESRHYTKLDKYNNRMGVSIDKKDKYIRQHPPTTSYKYVLKSCIYIRFKTF